MSDNVDSLRKKDVKKEASYWDNFYVNFNLSIPSQFAAFTAIDLQRSIHAIVEIGCGNGRDSVFFAEKGFCVSAIDKSSGAIKHNESLIEKRKMTNITFDVIDIVESDKVKHLIDALRESSHADIVVVYSRFFLHSITDGQQKLLICALQKSLKSGDMVYLEYRCSKDIDEKKIFTNHYRRFVDTNLLCEIVEQQEFQVKYQISGRGMARYKSEDAFVSRIILQKL